MSPKNPRLTVGLTALGLFGTAAFLAAGASDPSATNGQPSAPTTAAEPAPSPSTITVLLLSNGRLIQGQGPITREGDEYVLRQRGGVIRFHEVRVEAAFGSLAELYRYKDSLVPENDPDERLKLARWCLAHQLKAEARAQLEIVAALSPNSREASAMLASLNAEAARLAAAPRVDPGVVQTSGEAVAMNERGERPAELDSTLLRQARRELGVTGLPVIFDLPQAVAVKRADQFARVVHPVLQQVCVRCHNTRHEGPFRLIEVKSRKDWTPHVFRANLDATLQFVDPENPVKSELLALSLLPHGKGPTPRPIFRGSNDPGFQILSAWVNSLRSAPKSDDVTAARLGGAQAAPGGGFAIDRGGPTANFAPAPAPAPLAAPMPGTVQPYDLGPPEQLPPTRFVPGKGAMVENQPPSAGEFPVPFSAGGAAPGGLAPRVGVPAPTPPPETPGATNPAPSPATPVEGLPPGVEAGPPEVPTGPPKRTFKLDPKILERALMNRNSGR